MKSSASRQGLIQIFATTEFGVLRYRTDAETGQPGHKSKVGVCHTPESQRKQCYTYESKGKGGVSMTVWQLSNKQQQQQ